MMSEILVLRLVHVLGGTFWVGSGLFTGLFLIPALVGSGAAAPQVMGGLQQRRLFVVLPVVALLTIASGLRLLWLTSGGFAAAYFATPRGATFALSGGAAIVAFLLSLLVSRPSTVRASALMSGLEGADESTRLRTVAEASRLRRRGGRASQAALWLLVISAAGMAVARYLH